MRVVRAIRAWVADGRLAAGERLPAEEALAESLGVARGTVRSAIRELTAQGVLAPTPKHQRRTVTRPPGRGAAPSGLLSRTCVLISDLPEGGESEVLGYDDAVQLAIRSCAGEAGISLLALHPSACTPAGIDELVRCPPLGVLATHAVGLRPDGQHALARLRAAGIPAVAHGDDAGLAASDRVSSDSSQGTADLVRWLAARGCRRPLRVWSTRTPYWLHERDRGYAAACRELAIAELPPLHLDCPLPRSDAPDPASLQARIDLYTGRLTEHLLAPEPPDALLATSDSDVYVLAAACRRFGREPGRDILICGYDDYWPVCWERDVIPAIPAATVAKDNDRMGREMFRLLRDRVEGRLPSCARHVVVPQRVVVPPQ